MKVFSASTSAATSVLVSMLAFAAAELRVESGVTPIPKVIQMLGDMKTKAAQEKHEEQVQFAGFKQFCDDVSVEKQRAIETADAAIQTLQADIEKANTEVTRLGEEIMTHEAEIGSWQKDSMNATSMREVEREDYIKMHQDYSESISAITQAVSALKQQAYDRSGVAALLSKPLERAPAADKKVIDAFLMRDSEEPDLTFVAPPPPTAYSFQSQGIIDMLVKLKDKFTDELRNLEKDEVSRRHTYTSLIQDLSNSIKQAKESSRVKQQNVIKNKQISIEASGNLQEVTAARDGDVKYLKDLVATCATKEEDFKARQKLRTEEIDALDKAVEILSSDTVSGSGAKHLPSMLQSGKKVVALLQIQSKNAAPNQLRAAAYLREESGRIGSRVLSTIALHARDESFGKVKKLIQELIDRLMTQATEESTHKGWCDTELATNEHTRKKKTQEIEQLRSEIEGLTASVAILGKEIATTSAQILEIESAVANRTDMRNAEKAENEKTVKEAKEAQVAVAEAVKVLKDFYAKAGQATSMVQRKGSNHQEPPAIFDSPYQGQQSATGGVLGMLEVIKSDFARLETETSASEAAAQEEYETFMEDSAISKTEKEKDVEYKSNAKKSKEIVVSDKKTDLESAEQALSAAQASYEKLRPPCLDAGMTYEERVSRRQEEIEALQEALRILNGQDITALQQK